VIFRRTARTEKNRQDLQDEIEAKLIEPSCPGGDTAPDAIALSFSHAFILLILFIC
jgi:hypothetical protein